MSDVQSRLIASVTEPSSHAVVTAVTGWQATRLAYASGWAARRRARRGLRPTARAVGPIAGGFAVVAVCSWWISEVSAVQQLPPVPAGLVVSGASAAVAVVALAVSAVVLTRIGGATVRFCAVGEDAETIAVRVGDGCLMVEGWAYLDASRPGSLPRPRVAARRVLDFAETEGLRVYAAVSASAAALLKLYTAHGFREVAQQEVPWAARMPHALGARVVHLVRPVSPAPLGR
ncbi:MAG: hypothetical protein JHC70_05070 [Rhodococcus sp.]|nr:hypothetical protein [Rhodococcus sp. (in: high G+C Gram-positive bacteria)]MBJ7321699.1 hypothetical protein [Rhodococcus sp. (in: high G+C Gram-positive bacteria)]